jgi:hypothetical protein
LGRSAHGIHAAAASQPIVTKIRTPASTAMA